jgi:hypothetical protein
MSPYSVRPAGEDRRWRDSLYRGDEDWFLVHGKTKRPIGNLLENISSPI